MTTLAIEAGLEDAGAERFTEHDELRRSSFLLLGCVLTLLAFGIVMVYSAAAIEAAEGGRGGGSPFTPLLAHAGKVGVGLLLMFLAARLDPRTLIRLAKPGYIAALLLLALVLVPGIGVLSHGSRRWMATQTLLGFALQPSEIAKLALIVALAAYVAKVPDLGASFRKTFLPAAGAVLLPGALILLETDFGTFLLLTALGFLLLLLAGAKARHLALLALLALPAVGVFLALNPKTTYIGDRIASFVARAKPEVRPVHQPLEQIDLAESALRVGGMAGVGLGGGRHKLFFLAESENDFILAVIGEELGFVGTTSVIVLFALLLWSGRRVLLGVRHRFGFFVVAGVLITIAMQALINIFVSVRFAPVKGIPLPFVSSGGSSLTVLCLGIGMVLAIARHPELAPEIEAAMEDDEPSSSTMRSRRSGGEA